MYLVERSGEKISGRGVNRRKSEEEKERKEQDEWKEGRKHGRKKRRIPVREGCEGIDVRPNEQGARGKELEGRNETQSRGVGEREGRG